MLQCFQVSISNIHISIGGIDSMKIKLQVGAWVVLGLQKTNCDYDGMHVVHGAMGIQKPTKLPR